MIRFLAKALRYNMSAHISNIPNLLAATCGMLLNNIIFLLGLWGMLFAGKPENQDLLHYYIALNILIMTSYGVLCFFFGGWIEMGDLIINGHFESKLATPRHPLLLVGTHALHPSALGDLLLGLAGVGLLCGLGETEMAIRTFFASILAIFAFYSLFVLSGSLAFFIPRGNVVAHLVNNLAIILCSYPVGKIFPTGVGRTLMLLSPVAAISLMPMDWIEQGTLGDFALAAAAIFLLWLVAMGVYRFGVKRYQALNLVGAQS
ncbi:ABC-2 family transporter protein [Oligoflexus tunisiensis]|uniref:ABC-2 family transporter protein n=1 Tax=Oligoflexus tunisiensis TaxID=708132 RepID=UPI00114D39E2|nr:ABC-2 family transporter protein [Oligoflexus tunisiensis]